MSVKFAIILAITFSLFFIEALIHFNIGLRSNPDGGLAHGKTHTIIKIGNIGYLHIPDMDELRSIITVLLIFSGLSAFISNYLIDKHADSKK